MSFFRWNDAFGTGVVEMDAQHRSFLALLNELQEAAGGSRAKEVVLPVLDELSRYVAYHFQEEERLLRASGSPDLARQEREHAFFKSQLSELRERFVRGDAAVPESVLGFLRDWFLNHILAVDRNYGAYLAGVREACGPGR